jgi:hypothetical protein
MRIHPTCPHSREFWGSIGWSHNNKTDLYNIIYSSSLLQLLETTAYNSSFITTFITNRACWRELPLIVDSNSWKPLCPLGNLQVRGLASLSLTGAQVEKWMPCYWLWIAQVSRFLLSKFRDLIKLWSCDKCCDKIKSSPCQVQALESVVELAVHIPSHQQDYLFKTSRKQVQKSSASLQALFCIRTSQSW